MPHSLLNTLQSPADLRRLSRGELGRLRAAHGVALLWDAHSICSVMPRFFTGKLPDLNLGTHEGRACGTQVQAAVEAQMAAQTRFSHVSNARFKGEA